MVADLGAPASRRHTRRMTLAFIPKALPAGRRRSREMLSVIQEPLDNLAGYAGGAHKPAKFPGARAKVGYRFFQIALLKVRPQFSAEVKLRVGRLPE